MGTRAIYGFKKDNKYKVTYNHCDGDYECLGKNIVNFIKNTSIEKMNNIFEKIILVDLLDIPTKEQIEECKKYADLNVGTRKLEDFWCLLRKTNGHLEYYRDDDLKYMINSEDELNEECYQYIINLDTKQLEIFWYEMLVKSYDLEKIPENWIDECNEGIEICYQEYQKQNKDK